MATAGETLKLVTRKAIPLHGGIGMIKRAALLEAQWRNAAHHRDRFAPFNGY